LSRGEAFFFGRTVSAPPELLEQRSEMAGPLTNENVDEKRLKAA